MEAFAAFVLGLGMIAAAQDAAYAPYRAGYPHYYAAPAAYADAGYRPAYVYAPVPGPAPAVGALTGGVIGAAAGGAPGFVLGAGIGAITGDVISRPPVVQVAPVSVASAYVPALPARGAESTETYIRNWQGFVQPTPQR
jgi:hypothetical protein